MTVCVDHERYKKERITIAIAEGVYTGQYLYCGKTAPLYTGNILPVGSMPEGVASRDLYPVGAVQGCALSMDRN